MDINNWDNTRNIEPNQGFCNAAIILGGLSIITAVMMTVYLPFILGGIGIILAILSKGSQSVLPRISRTGVKLAIAGIILNICIVGGSFYTVFTNPEAKSEFYAVFEQMYGMSFDEMLNQMQIEQHI